jgi:myosin heavy subunit
MDNKKATEKLMTSIADDISPERFRFGHTKIFFKAGTIGDLEDLRDKKISDIITMLQREMRSKLAKAQYQKLVQEREGIIVIQANIRAFLSLKDWEWQKLMYKIKPLLQSAESQKEMEQMVKDAETTKITLEKETEKRKKLEENNIGLTHEKNDLVQKLREEQDQLADAEDRCDQLRVQKLKFIYFFKLLFLRNFRNKYFCN